MVFSSAFAIASDIAIQYSRNSILIIISCCIASYYDLYVVFLDKGMGILGGIYNITSVSEGFALFILILTSIILLFNSFYFRNFIINSASNVYNILRNKIQLKPVKLPDTKLEIYNIPEYSIIILFIIIGAVFLMCSEDFISLFISLELQSYGLYILSTIHRDSEQSTRAGLMYFLLGGLSSCFILLGSSLMYVNTGATSLDNIYIINSISDFGKYAKNLFLNTIFFNQSEYLLNNNISNSLVIRYIDSPDYINISMIIFVVGFLFKLSAAPFHFWSPDVYDSLPTIVTTFVAIIAKISIFVLLFDLVCYLGDTNKTDNYNFSWKDIFVISSLFSLIIGSILGLGQTRIKRLYAYSTISHVGFILLALSIASVESNASFFFYILSYNITNLNAFFILIAMGIILYFYIKPDQIKTNNDIFITDINTDNNINNIQKSYNNMLFKNSKKSINNNLKPIWGSINNYITNFSLNVNTILYNITKYSIYVNSIIYNIIYVKNSKVNNDYAYDYEIISSSNKNWPMNDKDIKESRYSPIQLVSQLKGFFYINPYLSFCLTITIFSFIGVPPLLGFFAKQMVLSAALDSNYIFITLIGIITSVIGAGYYLNIVKNIYFFKPDYIINPFFKKFDYFGSIELLNNSKFANNKLENKNKYIAFNLSNVKLTSAISIIIAIISLFILLFLIVPNQAFNLGKILSLIIYN